MNTTEAVTVLKDHFAWWKGDIARPSYGPKEVDEAMVLVTRLIDEPKVPTPTESGPFKRGECRKDAWRRVYGTEPSRNLFCTCPKCRPPLRGRR